ncbi:hypothetical protein K438DRAFT_1572484, partial [Mycena galopus ATCC 62051]
DGRISKVPSTEMEAVKSPLMGLFEKKRAKKFFESLQGGNDEDPDLKCLHTDGLRVTATTSMSIKGRQILLWHGTPSGFSIMFLFFLGGLRFRWCEVANQSIRKLINRCGAPNTAVFKSVLCISKPHSKYLGSCLEILTCVRRGTLESQSCGAATKTKSKVKTKRVFRTKDHFQF